MARKKAKTVEFKIHDNLITQLIRRQAGSLWKAVIEGIMNSVDAKASRVDITVTSTSVTIVDDGKGFRNAAEIENWFATLGMPPEDGELKTYGYFRMGRGQLFAYGNNEWRTGPFCMHVDINKDGRTFQLEDNLENAVGCTISVKLYNKLSNVALADTVDEITRNAKYVDLPIYLNGKEISRRPATQTWDIETEEADIKLRHTGNLIVYNQGIRVMDVPYYKYSMAGDVVAKKRLRVNFARNDVMSDCPVWKKITQTLSRHNTTNNQQASSRTYRSANAIYEEMHSNALRVKAGLVTGYLIRNLKLFTNINGTHGTISSIRRRQYKRRVMLGRLGDDGFSKNIMRDNVAYVFHPRTLELFEVDSVEELVSIIHDRFSIPGGLSILDYDEILESYGSRGQIIAAKDLTIREQALRLAIQERFRTLVYAVPSSLRDADAIPADSRRYRTKAELLSQLSVEIGSGERDVWIDPTVGYIAINRNIIRSTYSTYAIHRYILLMAQAIAGYCSDNRHSVNNILAQITRSPHFMSAVLDTILLLPWAYQKMQRRAPRVVLKQTDRFEHAIARNAAISTPEPSDTLSEPQAT